MKYMSLSKFLDSTECVASTNQLATDLTMKGMEENYSELNWMEFVSQNS